MQNYKNNVDLVKDIASENAMSNNSRDHFSELSSAKLTPYTKQGESIKRDIQRELEEDEEINQEINIRTSLNNYSKTRIVKEIRGGSTSLKRL